MEARTVTDRSNLHLMVQPISRMDAVSPNNFTRDTTQPNITSFTLDLDSNTLSLTFSEPVIVHSRLAHLVMISSDANPSSETISYNIMYSEQSLPQPTASHVITLNLSLADITFLEVTSGIATSVRDTYLSVGEGIAVDSQGISSASVASLQAHTVIRDTSPPAIVSFGLDLDEGLLDIHFNDPVNISAFSPHAITLQSAPAQRPMQWYTLVQESNSSVFYPNASVFQ